MYKQIIIVRKDLSMSAGKFAAQVSHASMAFIISQMKKQCYIPDKCDFMPNGEQYKNNGYLKCPIFMKEDCYKQWICGDFTKCILQAKNKNQLLKAKTIAEDLNMKEGEDFWSIYDLCKTELKPEENNSTLTCIGFRPMESEIVDKIGRKYHLYVG